MPEKMTSVGLLRALQTLWAVVLLLSAIMALRRPSSFAGGLTVMALMYAMATVGIWRDSRIAWGFSVVPPIVVFLWFGASALINFLAFFAGHELYQDSPARIFVVMITCFFTLLPASILLWLFWKNRSHFQQMWRARGTLGAL